MRMSGLGTICANAHYRASLFNKTTNKKSKSNRTQTTSKRNFQHLNFLKKTHENEYSLPEVVCEFFRGEHVVTGKFFWSILLVLVVMLDTLVRQMILPTKHIQFIPLESNRLWSAINLSKKVRFVISQFINSKFI